MTKGMFYIILSQAVFMLSGYIIQVFVGRSLGPELYGIFGIITAFYFVMERLFGTITSRGISKFIAEREEAGRSIINYSVKIQFFLSLIIFVIFFIGASQIASFMGDSTMTIYLKILSFMIIISGFYIIYNAALNGMRAFNKQAIVAVVYSLSKILFVILLVIAGYSLEGVVWGLVFAGIVCLVHARHYCKPLAGKGIFDKKTLISYSFKVILFTFATLLIMNIDLLLVKAIQKDGFSTGLYTAVLNLARIPTLMVLPISTVLFPFIVKTVSDDDKERTTQYVNRMLRYLVLFLTPLALMVSATSQEFITLIYGGIYSQAATSLSILIFGLTFIAISIMMNTIILAVFKLSVVIIFNYFLIVLDIALNFFLINKFGIVGASVATTITGLISCIFSIGYVFSHLPFTMKKNSLINIFLSGALVFIMALKYALPQILLLPSYVILYGIYFMTLFLLKEINTHDVNVAKNFLFFRHAVDRKIY